MTTPTKTIPLSDAATRLLRHPIVAAEIPVEAFQSLLLPTRRLGFPAYAFFAAPARRVPGQPLEVGTPRRWGALLAESGSLALFALTSAVPLGDVSMENAVLPLDARTLAEAKAAKERLTGLLDGAADLFFENGTVPAGLSAAFAEVVPDALRPHYRALAPDFMAALERAG